MPKNSSISAASLKPYDGFPLTAHRAAKQWVKKHKGTSHYFGPLADWEGALKLYEHRWRYIIKGQTPPPMPGEGEPEGLTIRGMANTFLETKRNQLRAGELSELSYRDYYRCCEILVKHFGTDYPVEALQPLDFEPLRAKLVERLKPTALENEINRIRCIFKYASDQNLIPRPVNYGQSFNRPTERAKKRNRRAIGPKVFERDELLRILSALDGGTNDVDGKPIKADIQIKAMTLLGLNCGLGPTDCGGLNESHLDLKTGWLNYPRPKTEADRRAPLWPETVEALKAVLAARSEPKDPADIGAVFLTRTRQRWVRIRVRTEDADSPEKNLPLNALTQAFGKLLHRLGMNGGSGRSFYTLRRMFEIVAGNCCDQIAVDMVMGHTDGSMAAVYRQGVVADKRLKTAVDTVRTWLYGVTPERTDTDTA